jgi:hypothetical protein
VLFLRLDLATYPAPAPLVAIVAILTVLDPSRPPAFAVVLIGLESAPELVTDRCQTTLIYAN